MLAICLAACPILAFLAVGLGVGLGMDHSNYFLFKLEKIFSLKKSFQISPLDYITKTNNNKIHHFKAAVLVVVQTQQLKLTAVKNKFVLF